MATELDIIGQTDPLYATSYLGYDDAELASLIWYMDQTISWMQGNNLYTDTESVVVVRLGVPYLGSDETVDASTVYTSDGNIDMLVASIGVDVVKITSKIDDPTLASNALLNSYTYKSPYTHKIFGDYFHDGIYNDTGLTYLDTLDVSYSKLATPLVKYSGVEQITPIIPMDVPDFILHCVQYMAQNPGLIAVMQDDDTTTCGDTMYLTGKRFFEIVVSAKYNAEQKNVVVSEIDLPPSREEAIRNILEYTGMDTGFESLDYGGLLEELRIVIRIPASRQNQEQMEGLLAQDEVFRDIFKEVWLTHSDTDVAENQKEEDLIDPYSTEVTDEYTVGGVSVLDNVYNGNYGCKRVVYSYDPEGEEGNTDIETISYRYWKVSDAWLHTLTAEKVAIVFWAGLDLESSFDSNHCPYDQIIIIVVIVVVTYFTAGLGSVGAAGLSAAQGLAIASAIVSIATTLGAVDAKTGKILGAVLAVTSLGTAAMTTNLLKVTTLVQLQFVLQVASTALTVVDTIESINHADKMEEIENQIEQLGESAEFYESEIRLMLGGYQDKHISEGCAIDYEEYITDEFDKYSIFDGPGFMES